MVAPCLVLQVLAQHIGLGEAHQTAAIKAATVLRYGSGFDGFRVRNLYSPRLVVDINLDEPLCL